MIGKIRLKLTLLIILIVSITIGCNTSSNKNMNRLAEWRKGVWISGDGTYTIYTNDHYFVISYEGDSASSNIYCGTSQLVFHNKGMARKQVLRLRQNPGGDLNSFRAEAFKTVIYLLRGPAILKMELFMMLLPKSPMIIFCWRLAMVIKKKFIRMEYRCISRPEAASITLIELKNFDFVIGAISINWNYRND
jgi:hypothetical protein